MSTKILVVDDDRIVIKILTDLLTKEGYSVFSTEQGDSVTDMAYRIRPDIILLDIMLPGQDGLTLCRFLKENWELKDIPVIMLTVKSEGKYVKEALEAGALDYIRKPVDEMEVVARVQSALRFKQHEDMLREMSMKDGLTGVYNHALLMELFEKQVKSCERSNKNIAFLMLDIDHFKNINDTYGHVAGDDILRGLARIMSESIRSTDIVGRYGGEEFGIVLPEVSKTVALHICERIRQSIERHQYPQANEIVKATISIGICFKRKGETTTYNEMLKRADIALYQAKQNGRNRVESWEELGSNVEGAI